MTRAKKPDGWCSEHGGVKLTDREHPLSCPKCTRLATGPGADLALALEAEAADLRARLREVSRATFLRPEQYARYVHYVADLRRKNWRKP